MAVWICRECTAAYSVGAPKCPQCGSTDRIEEEEQNMPKITVAGGPSIAGVTGGWSDHDSDDRWPAQDADSEGGEGASPGSSSSPSETSSGSDAETNSGGGSKRARTTGSRGGRAQTGSSSARSTDSGRTGRTSETGSDEDDEK